ncbi:calcium-transporting ATPase 3 isoform X2 [Carex littledalei]|uniref:Calcium-transporting ATPase 3 isoform X2 n=1 Tax=Carex littledalei TaxID=544730 RepID=A0A833VG03_9POAL|nr:calcium-transporting ATPase 3 isoform X2 [Carex littledalei]
MDPTNFINRSNTSNGNKRNLRYFLSICVGKLFGTGNNDGELRSNEEKRVCSWIYALAKADRDIAFEFVRSTERGLSFKEAERRRREEGPNIPFDNSFLKRRQLLWRAFFHPFNIILLVMATLSYLARDSANGTIMLALVLISVGLRFHQEYNSSMAAKHLFELLRSPVRVQRCAGRINQTELVVQIDQRDVVPGDIVHFSPGDLFPGDIRLITSRDLIVRRIRDSTKNSRCKGRFEDPFI